MTVMTISEIKCLLTDTPSLTVTDLDSIDRRRVGHVVNRLKRYITNLTQIERGWSDQFDHWSPGGLRFVW